MESKENDLVLCFELQAPNCVVQEIVDEMLSVSNAEGIHARWIQCLNESFKKRGEIFNLPLKDTVWYLQVIEMKCKKSSVENVMRIMALTERNPRGVTTLQVSLVQADEISYEEHTMKFVCCGCLNPIGRSPERPKLLACQAFEPSERFCILCEQLGITLKKERGDQNFYSSNKSLILSSSVRQCTLCSSIGNSESFKSCPKCEGVVYCSNRCLTEDWKESHHMWCAAFIKSMDMENAMGDFPFSFAKVTTARNFSRNEKKRFLEQHGIRGIGLWEIDFAEFDEKMKDKNFVPDVVPGDSLGIHRQLTEASQISRPAPTLQAPVTNWLDYYAHRGFPANSIICVLLNFSLTLYYIITSCLPREYADVFLSIQQTNQLIIHVIGAEIEIEMFKPFLECARLLYPVCLQIHLFGNKIDKHYAETRRDENLIFQIHRGLYHDMDKSLFPKPDIAVCFNGGLGAYPSFLPTIRLLVQTGVALYYTDYGLASISFSSASLQKCKAGVISEPNLNPFRSPLRITSLDQNLPRYSNAFITHIKPHGTLCS